MASPESQVLRERYRSMTARMAADPQMDLTSMRSLFDEVVHLTAEPEDVTYAEVATGPVSGIWCRPLHASAEHVILYLHGGGFVANSAATHRKLAAHLANAAGCRAFLVDYRRAPEHQFPAQLEDAVAAYRWLLDQGIKPDNILSAGDSAGGNLALSTVLQLRNADEPLPAGIIAFSPWLDMHATGETLDSNAESDALINRNVLATMSALYLGPQGSPTDPLASPLLAELGGLPPIFVAVGADEALLSDAQRLVASARRSAVQAELIIGERQQHVYPIMAGRCPEADAVIAMAGAWALRRFGTPREGTIHG